MQPTLQRILDAAGQVILGKETQLKLALACILARGHLLIEDLPGMGKSTLAHTLAQVLGLEFRRVQFTSDLLLADELNRATPKTQSALLEAMEEHQVTLDGETRKLPQPFFVIATQNPTHHVGAYPLPESQLDRFLMKIALGYPDAHSERNLLRNKGGRHATAQPCGDAATLIQLQSAVSDIHVSDALLDYLQALLDYTRHSPHYQAGLSPRAGLALRQCAQAWALIAGRDYALPEDVQAVLPGVVGHRLHAITGNAANADAATVLLRAVPVS